MTSFGFPQGEEAEDVSEAACFLVGAVMLPLVAIS